MRKTQENSNPTKPELTESRRQTLEDLAEILVDFMNADLTEAMKEKIRDLIDATEIEMLGTSNTEQ